MNPQPEEPQISELLERVRAGDADAQQSLAAAAEPLLRQLAAEHLRKQPDSLLESGALLNEAWMRLCGKGVPDFNGRSHFTAAASQTMRSILVDRIRRRLSLKRGGGNAKVELTETSEPAGEPANRLEELLTLDEVLTTMSPEDAQLAEYRLFGGLSCREIADLQGKSTRSVERHWAALAEQLKAELGR